MRRDKRSSASDIDDYIQANYRPFKAWMAAISAMLFMFVGSCAFNMLSPTLGLILDEFGASTNFGSDLSSIFDLTCAIIVLPIGYALNRWGFRRIGFIGYAILLMTTFIGATVADSEIALIFVRAFQGVGYAVPAVLGIYVITQWFPKDKQPIPIALMGIATSLAKVVVNQISKVTIPLGGWRAQFAAVLFMALIAFIFYILFMKPGPGYAAAEQRRREKLNAGKLHKRAPLSVVARQPLIWAVIIIFAIFSLGQRGFIPFANMIFVDNCGVSNNTASDINSFMSLLKIASSLMFGVIVSRCLKHRGVICAILLTIYFLSRTMLFTLNAEWQAWLLAFIMGIVGSCATFCDCCMPIFAKNPAILAMALALYDLIGKYVAGVIGPYVVSVPETLTGNWAASAIPMLATGVIAIIASWYVGVSLDRHTHRHESMTKGDDENEDDDSEASIAEHSESC